MTATTADPFRTHIQENSEDAEGVESVIRDALRDTGRVFVAFSNPWFVNQKLGLWSPALFADIERETDDAVLLKRVVDAREGIQKVLRTRQRRSSDKSKEIPRMPQRVAMGEATTRLEEGWFPKSAIAMMVTMDYPEDFRLFRVDGSVARGVSPETASAVVWERGLVQKGNRQYKKLVIDCDYETGQLIKADLAWNVFHPSAWYVDDEFVAWTVDDKPRKVGGTLAEIGVATAVHESLL